MTIRAADGAFDVSKGWRARRASTVLRHTTPGGPATDTVPMGAICLCAQEKELHQFHRINMKSIQDTYKYGHDPPNFAFPSLFLAMSTLVLSQVEVPF